MVYTWIVFYIGNKSFCYKTMNKSCIDFPIHTKCHSLITILTAIRYQFRLREKHFTFPSSCGSDMRNRLYSSHIANHIIRKVFYRPPFFHYSKGLLSLPDSKISPVCSSTEMISFVSENSTSRTCCTLGSFSSSANAPIISIDK